MESFPEPGHLIVQNRILAKVNNTTISVLDVVKKMEFFLHKYYPQYANSPSAKYQYFSTQWKEVLLQMIDQELILADADKMELKVTDSEVREIVCDRFGPNVMGSLDKLGVSYEEAKSMIHSELIVQRMTWFKVHAKALNNVNTKDVKNSYIRYCEQNPPKENWEYQVLSIKATDEMLAQEIAQKISTLCQNSPDTLSQITEEIKTSWPLTEEEKELPFTLSLSELQANNKDLSTAHKDVLHTLALHSISPPIRQVSRANQGTVYRIFYLKNHTKTPTPTLRSLYNKLHDNLVQEAANQETKIYLSKLRERYNLSLEEQIPLEFQPFFLQETGA